MSKMQKIMERFIKSVEAIKNQILKRFGKKSLEEKEKYPSNHIIQAFEDFDLKVQQYILQNIQLNKYELPIILCFINENQYVIITTEKIIIKQQDRIDIIGLSNFKGCGFKTDVMFTSENSTINLSKQEGNFLKFNFYKKDKTLINIDMPSGQATYALWNTSNVLEIVGTKYIIKEYLDEI